MGQVIYLDRIPVKVTSAAVVCSDSTALSYLKGEILSEGMHRSDVLWWVVLPQQDAGQQTLDWLADQLAAMDELRQESPNPYLIDVNGQPFDIGLIDIQVFMDVEHESDIQRLLQEKSQELMNNNYIHLDMLANTEIHDQMVLFQTMHMFDPSGKLRLHYHNVVMGLRREARAIGFLNLVPLLKAIDVKAKIGFVL